MSNKVDRIDSILFNYETTHRSDFRDTKMPHLQMLHVAEKIKSSLKSSSTEKDREKRKEKMSYTKEVDMEAERERGGCSHSRLVMPPAVSIDDIEDPRVRQILIKDMYTSTVQRSYNQSIANSARAPLPSRYTLGNPVALPKLTPPYVTPEWRLESAGWDRRQRRTNMEPTMVFWLNQNKYKEADKLK